ncbi:MAG: HD-GYP domain-containing protein [Caulobacteraceae bacterium]
MDSNTPYIDLNSVLCSISLALDLAEACALNDRYRKIDFEPLPGFNAKKHNFSSHSKRTAVVAHTIAQKLNFTDDRSKNLHIASLMHDIGAVDAFSVCHSEKKFIREHSDFGSDIIKKLPVDSSISIFIKYHHENQNGSGPNCLKGCEIPQESQIIHLADMFELMYKDELPYWSQKDSILEWIKSAKGALFSCDTVDALLAAAESERFWLDIVNINSDPDILTRVSPVIPTPIALDTFTDIALVFAALIDKKSAFTHEHSVGLSEHAFKLSKLYSFSSEKTLKLGIAALLHDLGKLSIPNHILDKPGKLTNEEYTIIKSHTYYTKLILKKIKGMEDIAEWAANHHETLLGTGYPEGLGPEKLSQESRILAVCDIFQALTEARPYRDGMPIEKAFSIMDSMVQKGNIDSKVVGDLKDII